MSKLKSNIIFNFLGSAWLGILTLAVTPIQVHFLGVEAFGFVGLITILQVLLGTLDLGISATVTKVVSSDHSDRRSASSHAVNTASSVYWIIALLIAVLLWWNSTTVAAFWLSRTRLDTATVTLGIQIIAVYLGLRWPVAFYTGVISGLQRMDVLNMIKASVQTLRLGGGVVVLFFVPDLVAFLVWFAISSAVELLVYAIFTYRLLPTLRLWPRFSLASFKDIWKYSAAMNLIALTALVLSQADRLAVTKFLSLEALGYYSIAYNASIAISLVQSAINSASFPAFSHSFSTGQHADLLSRYGKASQLMGLVVALPCFALVFFGHEVLQLWINARVADEAALTMAWLALGFFFNAMVSNAYMAAVACGQPGLPLKINLLALVLYLPALYWLAHQYGISGAAAAYAGLNAYYLFTLLPVVQARVLKQGMGMWLRANFLPFVLAGVGAFGSAKILAMAVQPGWQTLVSLALGVALYVAAAWFFLSDALRADLSNMIKRVSDR
ncbi:oligosaccharide flippase family protein [Polaromonas sp.]|uniref:oligosaccharide flippase family protein n=1 Tax=Polaromonas sp. TaxID=1869339 RepID=UPI002730999D|nr:oligosaccharide flippase family protein [Polaromonas sp.]MDP1740196.1 oligosaccharide flippase family protein [Polaromonas sp.]